MSPFAVASWFFLGLLAQITPTESFWKGLLVYFVGSALGIAIHYLT